MSFAKKYSRFFEKLARKILSEQLRLPEESIQLTKEHKDGGLDGFSNISMGYVFDKKLDYHLVFEAKLRSEKYNVGLDTFAKAMVVAFNYTNHGLAVVTNRVFTHQCCKEAALFSRKTGLQFIFIDGPRVSSWIVNRIKSLDSQGYPEEFLKGLIWKKKFDARYYDDITKAVVHFDPDINYSPVTKVSVEWEGPSQKEKLVGRVVTESLYKDIPVLIGAKRQKTVKDLQVTICRTFGLHLIWGDAGVGKSLAVSHVAEYCNKKGWTTDNIDLSKCFTSRDLFVHLLSALIGTNISAALVKFEKNEARAFIKKLIGTGKIDDKEIDSTVAVLGLSKDDHIKRSDLNHAVLITLLDKILSRQSLSRECSPPLLLILQEVTKASPEILDFLSRVLATFKERKVSVLIESRFSDQQGISTKHWCSFRELIVAEASTEHKLNPPTFADAQKYVEDLLPGIGPERAKVFIDRVGTIPLFLEAAADYLLEMNAIVSLDNKKCTIVEDLEVFFEGINPKKPIGILKRKVGYWWEFLPHILHAVALLDGKLPVDVVADLSEDQSENFLDKLHQTNLFNISSDLTYIEIKHSLLLDVVREYSEESIFTRKQVATVLLNKLSNIEQDSLRLQARKADLCAAAGRLDEAISLAHLAGKQFWQQHQLKLADKYLELSHNLFRQIMEGRKVFSDLEFREILLDLLELRDQRYRLGNEDSSERLADAGSIWNEILESENPDKESLTFGLRSGYLLWRSEHTQERFEVAEDIGRNLSNLLSKHPNQKFIISGKVVGNALSALGITLKAIGKTEESKLVFDEAIKQYPYSTDLEVQYHSNLAALYLGTDPGKSMPHYEHIIRLTTLSSPQFLAHLHAKVDQSMVKFLTQNYKEGMKLALQVNNIAAANGVAAQSARALNIAGCCAWAEKNIEVAYSYFQQAVLNAERSFSDRFLWRMRTNLASVALKYQQPDVARANAVSASDRILNPSLKSWAKGNVSIKNRRYQALIQCGVVLYNLPSRDELYLLKEKVPEPSYLSQVIAAAQGDFTSNVFSRASCIHEGNIMITG